MKKHKKQLRWVEEKRTSKKTLLLPKVEKKFDRFPTGYVNDVEGWTFTREEIRKAKETGSLLTLDVDLPGKGRCRLRCAHCFRRHPDFNKEKRLNLNEMTGYIKDAAKMGLKSVKLIGPAEPLEDPHLFQFLEMLRGLDVIPLIFTKGHPIGDDALAMRYHKMDGRALLRKLKEYNVSILLGTTSFNPELENSIVRREGYHAARHEAILRLVEAGFNDFIPGKATKLAFVHTPVMPGNIDEAFDIYEWTKLRNIQSVIAPTMIAGGALKMLEKLVVEEAELLDLYVKINLWAIERGMTTFEELEEQGIAAYAGGAPCNQVSAGAFLRGDGKLLRCPGDDYTILGNLKEQDIEHIWKDSENLKKYSGVYNNGCPPKEGISFPPNFFKKVMKEVRKRLG